MLEQKKMGDIRMKNKILIVVAFLLLIGFAQSSEIYYQILGIDESENNKVFETSETVFSVKTLNQDLLIDVKKVEIKANGKTERTLFYLTNENVRLALENSGIEKKPKVVSEEPIVEPVSPIIPEWVG